MRNLPRLVQSIIRVYESPAYRPRIDEKGNVLTTYCNFAIREIAGSLGYHAFEGMMADQIYDHMKRSQDWAKVEMKDSQFLANQGSLVIAALPSGKVNAKHGHVCVVRPGEEVYSSKWKKKVPVVLNIGQTNFLLFYKSQDDIIEGGVNCAFKNEPEFFAWRDSL